MRVRIRLKSRDRLTNFLERSKMLRRPYRSTNYLERLKSIFIFDKSLENFFHGVHRLLFWYGRSQHRIEQGYNIMCTLTHNLLKETNVASYLEDPIWALIISRFLQQSLSFLKIVSEKLGLTRRLPLSGKRPAPVTVAIFWL